MRGSPGRGTLLVLAIVGVAVVIGACVSEVRSLAGDAASAVPGGVVSGHRDAVRQSPHRIATGAPGISRSAIAVQPVRSWSGIYPPRTFFTLAALDLATGSYVLDYSFSARFAGPVLAASSIECALVEAGSGIRLEPQQSTVIRTTDGWTERVNGFAVALPSMTVELRCSPARSGTMSFDTRDLEYTAFRPR